MPAQVVVDYVEVPWLIVVANQIVTILANMFFVDGAAFLITVSWHIKFITVKYLQPGMATSLSKHLKRVLQVYGQVGFRVRTILMDGEFEKVEQQLPNVECNTTVAKEHVRKAECTIRTIKESTQGLIVTLPFTDIP
jgi:hypothetical protein